MPHFDGARNSWFMTCSMQSNNSQVFLNEDSKFWVKLVKSAGVKLD
jgi:hypothetical protein